MPAKGHHEQSKNSIKRQENGQRVNIQCEELLQANKEDREPNSKPSKECKRATHGRNKDGRYGEMLNLTASYGLEQCDSMSVFQQRF